MFVKLRLSCVDPKMSAGVAILSLNNIPALGGGGGSASSTSWSTPEVATEKSILFIYSIGKCSPQSHAWKQISHQLMTSAEFSLLQFVVARFHGIGMSGTTLLVWMLPTTATSQCYKTKTDIPVHYDVKNSKTHTILHVNFLTPLLKAVVWDLPHSNVLYLLFQRWERDDVDNFWFHHSHHNRFSLSIIFPSLVSHVN